MLNNPALAARPPNTMRRVCPVSFVIVFSMLTIVQQHVGEPARRIYHHVVAGLNSASRPNGLVKNPTTLAVMARTVIGTSHNAY
jgi:hypothetical protein